MKKRLQFTVFSVLLLGLLLRGVGQTEELKIAFLDAQKVLNGAKEGVRLRQVLDEFVKARQKVIDLDEQELKRLKDDLDKQGVLLSQEALSLKQGEIEEAILQYRKKVTEFQKEVQDKRLSALSDFNQKLEYSVKEIADKEGYGLVLDKNTDRGTVIYGKEQYDITAKVIEQMDKSLSKDPPKGSSDPKP